MPPSPFLLPTISTLPQTNSLTCLFNGLIGFHQDSVNVVIIVHDSDGRVQERQNYNRGPPCCSGRKSLNNIISTLPIHILGPLSPLGSPVGSEDDKPYQHAWNFTDITGFKQLPMTLDHTRCSYGHLAPYQHFPGRFLNTPYSSAVVHSTHPYILWVIDSHRQVISSDQPSSRCIG
ncbi:hypothetical protein EI94DRAFT_1752840 [Lactarius quietus]|nr:hypothetical protein EI94DRAFT_1752840 [Lactarius quietus]